VSHRGPNTADCRKGSKKKKGGAASAVPMPAGVFAYHPEEEYIDKASW